MARVPYINNEDLPPEHQGLPGNYHNVGRAFANSPVAARHLGALGRAIRDGGLDARLRELAIVQIAYALNRPYVYAHHLKVGLANGCTPADLRAVADETAGRPTALDPLTKAVLRTAREMTLDASMSDESFAGLKAGMDTKQIVDLLFIIGMYNAITRMVSAMELEPEEQYGPYLKDYPLGGAGR